MEKKKTNGIGSCQKLFSACVHANFSTIFLGTSAFVSYLKFEHFFLGAYRESSVEFVLIGKFVSMFQVQVEQNGWVKKTIAKSHSERKQIGEG